MNNIIIPSLKGGLGNQLFQISAAYSLALHNNCEYGVNYNLPSTRIQGHGPDSYRHNLYTQIPTTDHVPANVYNEPRFSYDPIPFQNDLLLDGYFQSDKYFDSHSDDVKSLFKFPDEIVQKIDSTFSKLQKYTVGLHIRRGDYKTYNRVHPLCPPEYYKEAIKVVSNKDAAYIVCTDDIDSVCEEFDTSNLIISNAKSELEDLYLLSQCDSVIICNSTFSWWGAYLGKKKDKVIAPEIWFGPDGPSEYSDVYVKEWIKI